MEYKVLDSEIDNFKLALRIDTTADDSLIADYLKVAKAYVTDAVKQETNLSEYDQFNFAVQMLAQYWYQNRPMDIKDIPYQVISMIQQLRGKL